MKITSVIENCRQDGASQYKYKGVSLTVIYSHGS